MCSAAEDVIEQYVAAWNSLDFQTLESHWDSTTGDIYYVAEEIEYPFYQLVDVIDYWQKTAAIVERLWMTTSDQRSRLLADDICVVTYSMHMDAELRGSKPIGVDVRVSTILKYCDHDWGLIHYAEAPLGALPFLRKAYNSNYTR